MKAKDVFTPGSFPTVTYVGDHLVDRKKLLEDALYIGSTLISISGPSKSGKTVFVEQCTGRDNLIQITGAGVNSAEGLWIKVFNIIGTPGSRVNTKENSISSSVSSGGSIEGNVIVVKGKADISGTGSYTHTSIESKEYRADYLSTLITELANTDFIIFIDDFHYISRDIQKQIAVQIKEAIRNGVKFICASVPYRADDVIRSNPDLMGRVQSINLDYWKPDVLKKLVLLVFLNSALIVMKK